MTAAGETVAYPHDWLTRFRGVVTAVVTPFTDSGRVDDEGIDALVELQVDAGVGALMVGGTTGEFLALQDDERRHVLERFLGAVSGRVPVIANVGDVDQRRAKALAEHAVGAGVAAVTAITPYFFPTTVAASTRYFRDLARTVAPVPFLVYNFPRNAANLFPADAFEALLDEPNLAGAKCSIGEMDELTGYLQFEPQQAILCGNDRIMDEFVGAGGRGIVSGNAAAYPDLIVAVFDRLLAGSWTEQDAALVADIATAGRDGAPDRLKVLLQRRGIGEGSSRIRSYVEEEVPEGGNDEARDRVEKALVEHGAQVPR